MLNKKYFITCLADFNFYFRNLTKIKFEKLLLLAMVVAFSFYFMNVSFASEHSNSPLNSEANLGMDPGKNKQTINIGILLPMDHSALRAIVQGYQETLQREMIKMGKSDKKINFKVQNAQGDLNLQRSILQQFQRQKMDLIVPIGTQATQMSASLIKDIPIVSLAANQTVGEKLKQTNIPITGVVDEIGPEKILDFLHELDPNLSKITLIYSNNEKIMPEVEEAMIHGNKIGIKIQKLMIQSLPELYTISKHVDQDTGLLLILKDHMVVSGIQTLAKEASKRKLPLMTSDEGSVQEGGTFGLGVKESSIGEEGAILSVKILSGQTAQSIPIQKLQTLVVFFNNNASQSSASLSSLVTLKNLTSLAKKLNYKFHMVKNEINKKINMEVNKEVNIENEKSGNRTINKSGGQ